MCSAGESQEGVQRVCDAISQDLSRQQGGECAAAHGTVAIDVSPAVCLQHILLTDSALLLQLFLSWSIVTLSINKMMTTGACHTAVHKLAALLHRRNMSAATKSGAHISTSLPRTTQRTSPTGSAERMSSTLHNLPLYHDVRLSADSAPWAAASHHIDIHHSTMHVPT